MGVLGCFLLPLQPRRRLLTRDENNTKEFYLSGGQLNFLNLVKESENCLGTRRMFSGNPRLFRVREGQRRDQTPSDLEFIRRGYLS